jgi:hypothetical protein
MNIIILQKAMWSLQKSTCLKEDIVVKTDVNTVLSATTLEKGLLKKIINKNSSSIKY